MDSDDRIDKLEIGQEVIKSKQREFHDHTRQHFARFTDNWEKQQAFNKKIDQRTVVLHDIKTGVALWKKYSRAAVKAIAWIAGLVGAVVAYMNNAGEWLIKWLERH